MLNDLQTRLKLTRWVDDFANEGWQYGTNTAYLKELVAYWIEGYDWRKQERAINAYPQFRTEIDGVPIHFVHVRGKGPNPKPLILSHGWPWTFWEYHKVVGPLSDPDSHGGDRADAFDVVVPCLPGYGFSTPLRKTGVNFWRTSGIWVELMERLGYSRFCAHGADWGALVTADLGHRYPERLMGVHFPMMLPLDLFCGGLPAPEDYDPDEAPLAARLQKFFATESAYSALQCTKPQTIAAALNDSPVGLASWILEKQRSWSDCHGDVETRFTKDDLLTTIMIYWVTQSYGTSARYYYEAAHHPWTPVHDRMPVVEAPVGISVFPEEICCAPRRWAQRYYNLKQWRHHVSGGHFAGWEEPQAIVTDVRDFFRTLT
ncbi:epoxide hydrolase [Variovorax paradoxus]|nr:epoxide hydrolase [Variovorax paradoxus]